MTATSELSTDAEMNAMAGENVNVTGWVDANKTAWGIQAEAYLVSISRYDWVTNKAKITAKGAALLSEYVSRYTATAGIGYNMSDFKDSIEAEDMLKVHLLRMEKIEKILSDDNTSTFLIK